MNCAFGFEKCLIVFSLGLIGRQRSKPLMGTIIVIKLNVFGHSILELVFCFVEIASEIFFFDRDEKRFGNGIVMRGTRSRKRLNHTELFKKLPEFKRCILSSLVTMKSELFWIASRVESFKKCLFHRFCVNMLGNAIRYDFSGVKICDYTEI